MTSIEVGVIEQERCGALMQINARRRALPVAEGAPSYDTECRSA
jgi:hypothetical protein